VPSPSRCLTAGDAFDLVREQAIQPSTGVPRVGLELEWLSYSIDDRARRVTLDELTPLLETALPCGSRVTIEPGGQIEISTPACDSVDDAIATAREDVACARAVLARSRVELVGQPIDTVRAPQRVLDTPRYRAMETYFAQFGAAGARMMSNSASMHVHVDVVGDPSAAWRNANAVARAFGGRERAELYRAIDPSRTAEVEGDDPGEAWARYALAARVMFIRVDADTCIPILDPVTLDEWTRCGHPLGWPTRDDLAEHLTTLFPPVRPRGFLELRTIDAHDDDTWPLVAEQVVRSLLETQPCR
jgi:glutamate--cysteine ligase